MRTIEPRSIEASVRVGGEDLLHPALETAKSRGAAQLERGLAVGAGSCLAQGEQRPDTVAAGAVHQHRALGRGAELEQQLVELRRGLRSHLAGARDRDRVVGEAELLGARAGVPVAVLLGAAQVDHRHVAGAGDRLEIALADLAGGGDPRQRGSDVDRLELRLGGDRRGQARDRQGHEQVAAAGCGRSGQGTMGHGRFLLRGRSAPGG
ncbi:MAG: hypothetical protein DWQ30_00635 [Acidobacteria bacterium]|nr:MAG: hypothetical protein DWQ30_00635 [Acidobacteriota bacterium]